MSQALAPRPFSEPSPLTRWLAAMVVVTYAVVSLLPLAWIGATAFKSQSDAIAYPPKVLFTPTLEGFVDLFTVQTHQPHDFIAKLPPPSSWYEKIARDRDMVIAGPSRYGERFLNSFLQIVVHDQRIYSTRRTAEQLNSRWPAFVSSRICVLLSSVDTIFTSRIVGTP